MTLASIFTGEGLSPSTRGAIRTVVHCIIATITVGAIVLPLLSGFPALVSLGAGFVAASAFINKVWTRAEDKGVIPPWLRDVDDVSEVESFTKEALGILSGADDAP